VKIKLEKSHKDFIHTAIRGPFLPESEHQEWLAKVKIHIAEHHRAMVFLVSLGAVSTVSTQGEIEIFSTDHEPPEKMWVGNEHFYMLDLAFLARNAPQLASLLPKMPLKGVHCHRCNGKGTIEFIPPGHTSSPYEPFKCNDCAGMGWLPSKGWSIDINAWYPITLSDYGLSAPDDDPTP
jgi:hypothetical protein